MKKVLSREMSANMNEEDTDNSASGPTPSPQLSSEPMVRTTGRIKKPKAVFDPSDNYLPRAQRLSSSSQHSGHTSAATTERRASSTKSSTISPVASTTEPPAVTKEACIVCKKRESKRPVFANKNRLISCLDCEKKIHKLCLKVDFEDVDFLLSHYKCEQCANCCICEQQFKNPDEEMITCSKCIKSFHIICFPAKIEKSDQRNWKCNKCHVVYNHITNGTTLPVKKIREIIGSGEPATPISPPKPTATSAASNKTSADEEEKKNGNVETSSSSSPIKRSHKEDDKNDSVKSLDSLNNGDSSPAEKRAKPSNNQSTDDHTNLDSSHSSITQTKSESTNICYSPNEPLDDIPDVKQWSVDQVHEYFIKHFPKEAHVFKDEEIDGRSLLLLKRSDVVKKLPIKLGPSLRIYSLILKIQAQVNDPTLGWNCGL